jgi:tetrahydromethanopterin S-methyltransferase subunit B
MDYTDTTILISNNRSNNRSNNLDDYSNDFSELIEPIGIIPNRNNIYIRRNVNYKKKWYMYLLDVKFLIILNIILFIINIIFFLKNN